MLKGNISYTCILSVVYTDLCSTGSFVRRCATKGSVHVTTTYKWKSLHLCGCFRRQIILLKCFDRHYKRIPDIVTYTFLTVTIVWKLLEAEPHNKLTLYAHEYLWVELSKVSLFALLKGHINAGDRRCSRMEHHFALTVYVWFSFIGLLIRNM